MNVTSCVRATIRGVDSQLHVDILLPMTSLADLCSDLVPKITCQVGAGLISRLWLRTPC